MVCIETVLFLTQLPVFTVFEQKDYPVVVEGHPLNIRIYSYLNHLFPVVKQIPNQQASSTLYRNNSRTIHLYCFSIELDLLTRCTHAVQVPFQHVPLSCAHIEEALIFVEIDGSGGI